MVWVVHDHRSGRALESFIDRLACHVVSRVCQVAEEAEGEVVEDVGAGATAVEGAEGASTAMASRSRPSPECSRACRHERRG